MQVLRDEFLDGLFLRYPQLDQDEIFAILEHFRKPDKEVFEDREGPWPFDRLRVNQKEMNFEMSDSMVRSGAQVDLGIELQPSLPKIDRLSLEQKQEEQHIVGRAGISGFVNPNAKGSDASQIFATSQNSVDATNYSNQRSNFPSATNNLSMESRTSSLFTTNTMEEEIKGGGGHMAHEKNRMGP